MQVDRKTASDEWKLIEEIERETKLLLDAVREKRPPPQRKRDDHGSSATSGASNKKKQQQGSSTSNKKGQSDQFLLPLPLPTPNKSKSTVEILDDASPDLTPRELNTREQQALEHEKRKQNRFQKVENSFRNLLYESEQIRIRGNQDTFVGTDRMTFEDVEREMKRLHTIEHSAKTLKQIRQYEQEQVTHYLEVDRAALRVQKTYRGYLGRRKYALISYLQTLQLGDQHPTNPLNKPSKKDESKVEDWIEVKDDVTGDIWYYNRLTNKSQWEKPSEMIPTTSSVKKSSSKKKKSQVAKDDLEHEAINAEGMKTMTISMSLPSLSAMKAAKVASHRYSHTAAAYTSTKRSSNAKLSLTRSNTADTTYSSSDNDQAAVVNKEIEHELGLHKLEKPSNLTAPDGYFKPQLRTVVLDALLDTRFDNVSTVLSDKRWFDNNQELIEPPPITNNTGPYVESKVDPSKQQMVSVLTFNKKKARNKHAPIRTTSEPNLGGTIGGVGEIKSASDLTLKNVEHVGFEGQNAQDTMCFGCWSAGLNRHCTLHQGNDKLKPSQTMLLCRNWDLDVMRRRYRSEELQEIFLQREASLRYNTKRKQFFTISEQRHPIYRMQGQILERLNNRMTLFMKIKYWLLSLAESFRQGKVHPNAQQISQLMRVKRGIRNLGKITRYSSVNREALPKAPITGSSWPERMGTVHYLFTHVDGATGQEVDIIMAEPVPIPVELYKPRSYHVGMPKTIPLPRHSNSTAVVATDGDISVETLPANTFIPDLLPASWIERLSSQLVRDSMNIALQQVHSITPLTPVILQERTKRPTPVTTKFATIGRKPQPNNNLAVGGLPLEMLIYQIVSTFYPPQYGNFMVMDKASISPGVSLEVSISFVSVIMPPTIEGFVERPLEHPLTYRRAPTIALNSNVSSEDKHVYGVNRPEQTGEQASHGFRTTAWSPMLGIYGEIDPSVFIPGQTVVSLNIPKANISCTTHADVTYPFCQPSTRDNSTLDFYHLLLTGVVSTSKAQVFTALSVQEPGQFQMKYRLDQPMGHLIVAVYRSWAFTQYDTIQEFTTDDGVSYWYHRKTGQTFWERPMYEVEETSPLLGGTILDPEHNEEPSIICRGDDASALNRRFDQGEFREVMLKHIETKKEALHRRRAAAITVKHARDRGQVPDITNGQVLSVINNANSTLDEPGGGLSRIDFSKQSLSNMPNTEPSEMMTMQQQQQMVRDDEGEEGDLMGMYQQQHGQPFAAAAAAHHSSPQHHQQPHGQQGGGGMMMRGSALDDNQSHFNMHQHQQMQTQQMHSQSQYQQHNGMQQQQQMGMMMPGGFDAQALMQMTQTLGAVFSTLMSNGNNGNITSNPAQFLQLGMTMGAALLGTGAVNGMVQQQIDQQPPMFGNLMNNNQQYNQQQQQQGEYSAYGMTPTPQQQQPQQQAAGGGDAGFFPALSDDQSLEFSGIHSAASRSRPTRVSVAPYSSPGGSREGNSGQQLMKGEPIGLPTPTAIYSSDKTLDHSEEGQQKLTAAERFCAPLTTMEKARNLQILGEERYGVLSDTPDVRPPKILTVEKASTAEEALQIAQSVPILAYPELTTTVPGGAPPAYKRKLPAGEGTSFVPASQQHSQMQVGNNAPSALRKQVMPLPVGFFAAIEAKHVATAAADYLPQVPNLPQSRNIGRVKPRSAASDWLMINFDPWSAGKNPLSAEFVPSLMSKADRLLGMTSGGAEAQDTVENLRNATVQGAYVTVEDEEGLAVQRQDISKAQILAQDYKNLCSLCRHGKFTDAEQLINQPDWAVPIDYQDDQGNALLHVAAQNGNKRLVKLCMRRGADLNLQNLNGQTPLHFACGYGYDKVVEYLLDKGADDSLRNKDGLTCYEGLGARELALL